MPNNNTPPNASQACAACKHQRRKCAPNCTLAPYFPANRTQNFLNAHKLFGISKIMKTLASVPPSARQSTVNSLVFEANKRSVDPIGGCYRMVRDLECRISVVESELDIVLRQLAAARAHRGLANPNPSLRFCDARVSMGGLGVYDEGGGKINVSSFEGMECPVPIQSVKVDESEASCSYLPGNSSYLPGNGKCDDKKPGSG